MNKVVKVALDQFCGEQIIWLYYANGTYQAIFINEAI